MMSGYRNILWMLPVALLLSWPVWGRPITRLLAPRGSRELSAAQIVSPAKTSGGGFSMEGVLFSQLKNGAQDWQIKAKRLFAGEDQERMQLVSVEAQVFKNAERKFVITGQEGEYNSKKKNLIMRNEVKILAESGFVVQSDSISYDDQAGIITTLAPVQITGKDMDILGQKMIYDMRNDSYDVSGRVKVDLK